MLNQKEFIMAVEEFPALYNISKNQPKDRYVQKQLWAKVAKKTGLKNGLIAKRAWERLTSKYKSCLVNGTTFRWAQEMQFMQMPLLNSNLQDDEYDFEIDEEELEQILKADDEAEYLVDHILLSDAPDTELEDVDSRKSKSLCKKTETIITNTEIKIEKGAEPIEVNSGNFNNLTSLELIFLGYAKTLQRMPIPLQLKTKRLIANIINAAEEEMFDKN